MELTFTLSTAETRHGTQGHFSYLEPREETGRSSRGGGWRTRAVCPSKSWIKRAFKVRRKWMLVLSNGENSCKDVCDQATYLEPFQSGFNRVAKRAQGDRAVNCEWVVRNLKD